MNHKFGRRLSLDKRVKTRIGKARRTLKIDTQHTRRHLLEQLEKLFDLASDYARGEIKRVTDGDGKERSLTPKERQLYSRIAAYTAQVINSIVKGIDERQIDADLDKLEEMLHKTSATIPVQPPDEGGEQPGQSSEGASDSSPEPNSA
jgi:DNA-binding MarR family transcriptional regulator